MATTKAAPPQWRDYDDDEAEEYTETETAIETLHAAPPVAIVIDEAPAQTQADVDTIWLRFPGTKRWELAARCRDAEG